MGQILDTKQHGVPQSRLRWYCVGIQKKFDTGKFEFPEPIARPSIEQFLERRDSKLVAEGLPPVSQTTARGNVIRALRDVKKEGSDPAKEAFIVDCDSSPGRSVVVRGYSPCITCSRGAGHWLTNRGRRMLKTEMMRLQGMNPTKFMVAVSESRLGHQLGNTMSVCVLERLFTRLLPAAKLVGRTIKDRWASGQALRKLMSTRGKSFKGMSAKAKNARGKGVCRANPTCAVSRSGKRAAASFSGGA